MCITSTIDRADEEEKRTYNFNIPLASLYRSGSAIQVWTLLQRLFAECGVGNSITATLPLLDIACNSADCIALHTFVSHVIFASMSVAVPHVPKPMETRVLLWKFWTQFSANVLTFIVEWTRRIDNDVSSILTAVDSSGFFLVIYLFSRNDNIQFICR